MVVVVGVVTTILTVVTMLPSVGLSSSIKLYRPIKIVPTDQIGFHVSGWKSDIDIQSRVAILKRPEGVSI